VTLTGCTTATLSPAAVSQPAGSLLALSESAGGGCATPVYEFWVQYPNGSWKLVQGWGTSGSFNWDTTGLAPGVYTVHGWANQQGAAPTLEVYGTSTVTLTGCTSSSVSPASGSAARGAQVTFTASSGGCPNPVYEFWLQDPSGVWHLMQAFGSSGTWTWNTAGWAKGKYTLHVWANQQGASASTYETIGSATYSVT
jgi:hypothetical protein